MKKAVMIVLSCLCFFCFTAVSLAQAETDAGLGESNPFPHPAWEIALQEWKVNGWFDYMLYYPGGSQLVSKVSFPQDQLMTLLDVEHTLPNGRFFILFQYGQSGQGIKGRGSDSDWMIPGANTLTHYGDFDSDGDQRLVTLDLGIALTCDERQRTSVLLGLMQQDTVNELKNVVYHRYDGVDIGAQAQEDSGSTLNGKFRGIRLGIEKERRWPKWTWIGRVGVTLLETKAYGHWTNYDPAWNWVDSGYTVGWTANLGLQYAIARNFYVELGYYGNYAKTYFNQLACDEFITGEGLAAGGEELTDRVGLRYQQQGFRLGLKLLL
jgi:opacity protein-like surface antigen